MNKNEIVYVNIHNNPVPTVLHEGKPYVGMAALCEQMGLDWEGQRQRINRDENLKATTCVIKVVASDGKNREMVCLPLDMINGWLFGIDANRVKPEIRELVLSYQRECYAVLYDYWHGKGAVGTLTPADEIRYMNQRLALLKELMRARSPRYREDLYAQYKIVSERLGFAVPALSEYHPPHPHDLLDDSTRAILDAFWHAYHTLTGAAGIPLNHHRDGNIIAINLKEILQTAESNGIPMPSRPEIMRALPQCREPHFIGASVTVNSAIRFNRRGIAHSVRCYLFRKIQQENL